MPFENRTFALLDEEAARRGVSVQELLRTVVVPEWFRKSHMTKGEVVIHQSLAHKLTSLEKAFQDLKAEIEKGVLVDQGGGTLLRPVELIRSIESLLAKTFGRAIASNLLYEIGKEAGRRSVSGAEKCIDKISSINKFQQVCNSYGPAWGWRRLQMKNFEFARRVIISKGEGSIYIRSKTGRVPICHFGRGALAGALETILRANCESIETACEGKRDAYCEFAAGAPDEIARLAESLEGPAVVPPTKGQP